MLATTSANSQSGKTNVREEKEKKRKREGKGGEALGKRMGMDPRKSENLARTPHLSHTFRLRSNCLFLVCMYIIV